MGSRGPVAKTASQRAAEGKSRADRASEPPKAPAGAPAQPAGLDRRAAAAWKQLVRELESIGLLAKSDSGTMEACAVAIGRARECRTRVNRDGIMTRGSTGQLVAHPALKLERELWAQAARLLEALGLTAASRLRMQMPVGGAGGASSEGEAAEEPPADLVTARIGAAPRLRRIEGGQA